MHATPEDGIQNKELLLQSNLEGKCDRYQPAEIVIDAAYQHRKGGCYWLIAIARPCASADIPPGLRSYRVMHSETEEVFEVHGVGGNAFYVASLDSPKLAIYQAIGGAPSKAPAGRWGRSLEMFRDGRFTLLDSTYQPEPCYYDPLIMPGCFSMHHCPVCGEMVIAGVPHV